MSTIQKDTKQIMRVNSKCQQNYQNNSTEPVKKPRRPKISKIKPKLNHLNLVSQLIPDTKSFLALIRFKVETEKRWSHIRLT